MARTDIKEDIGKLRTCIAEIKKDTGYLRERFDEDHTDFIEFKKACHTRHTALNADINQGKGGLKAVSLIAMGLSMVATALALL